MRFSTRLTAACCIALGALLPAAPAFAAAPTPAPVKTAQVAAAPSSSPSTSTPAPANPARSIKWAKIDDHSAKLSWRAPSGAPAGQKTHYVVFATVKLGSKTVTTYTQSDTTATSITYKKVPAGATITAEVTTAQRFVAGKHDKAPKYTQPQLKMSAPRGVKVVASGVSVKATWQAPKTNAGTLLSGYRATLYKAATGGNSAQRVKELSRSKSQVGATFTKLSGETKYYVEVRALNSAGTGGAGKSATITTGVTPSSPAASSSPAAVTATPSQEPSALPTVAPTDGATLAPGVTVPSQQVSAEPTQATPLPSATPVVRPVDTTGPIVLVLGGCAALLAVLGFVGWRRYRRYS